MAKNLSDTWILIRIKDMKYCLNSGYSKGITELKPEIYKNPIRNAFIKGNYEIYGAILPVIDIRRILGYKSTDDEKLEYSSYIHEIIYEHRVWIDQLEWTVITKDEFNGDLRLKNSSLMAKINGLRNKNKQVNVLVNKMIKPLRTIYTLADDMINSEHKIFSKYDTLEEIKRQSDNYVVKNLEKLIELNNGELMEKCLVIDCKDIKFGITADEISMITNKATDLTKICRDKMSAGTIKLKNNEYNVMNLTKLMNIVKNGG